MQGLFGGIDSLAGAASTVDSLYGKFTNANTVSIPPRTMARLRDAKRELSALKAAP